MTFPPMRPQIELQRKHDLLMTVLGTPLEFLIEPGLRPSLRMAADCLCWCLHHDSAGAHPDSHAADFAKVLGELDKEMSRRFGEDWGEVGAPEDYIVEE